MAHYSLRKSRKILFNSAKIYEKNKEKLSDFARSRLFEEMKQLNQAIESKEKEKASSSAKRLEEELKVHVKKPVWMGFLETCGAILIALAIALIVRQCWFELYEIPTGSMRPTFKEQDHLSVTKTAFGLNLPLTASHLYFDPDLVQRESAIIWTGEGISNLDAEAKFMGVFPYTKRYIKRCMGKPGDTLYFYGGRIYAFDKSGHDLEELRNNPWTEKLEYIPFSRFQGKENVEQTNLGSLALFFRHFNVPIGRFVLSGGKGGQVFNGKEWIKDNPIAQTAPHTSIETFSDFFGIRNFAMARLLTKEELQLSTPFQPGEMEEAELYLEIRHTPSLSYPNPVTYGKNKAALSGYTTVIPLQKKHLEAIRHALYTCRFEIKNGKAAQYRLDGARFGKESPDFKNVPNGKYEFYYGKGWQIGFGAIAYPLPEDHPLYAMDVRLIQKLYNVGIEMNRYIEPSENQQIFFPSRYVYFREGNLYTMGGLLMEKQDPLLLSFHKREEKRASLATSQNPYVPFKDYGPPLNADGTLDKEFIKTFGYKVPDKGYLALGDNHAMSQDSRYFGPVPESNLQGAPSIIFWPPGERLGMPNQKPYPLFTLPRLIVWSVALLGLLGFLFYRKKEKERVHNILQGKQ